MVKSSTPASTLPPASRSLRGIDRASASLWVTTTAVMPEIAVHLAEELVDALAGRRVEVAGGLVGQQHVGLEHQRARQRHALRLAARELAGLVVHARAQPHPLQQLARALASRPGAPSAARAPGMATFSSAVNSGSR